MTHRHWPLFDLRVRTKRLELRPDWDEGTEELAELAAAGIHDPETMPFTEPWSDAPPGEIEREVLQWHWKHRGAWTTDAWQLTFLVSVDGAVVGSQGITGKHFPTLRTFETGSWLGRRFQAKGIGREMRAAVLYFGFVGLGAERALSGAFDDNRASLGVSRALGYRENGDEVVLRRQSPGRIIHLALTRADWEANRWPDPIAIDGLEACLPLFGLGDEGRGL